MILIPAAFFLRRLLMCLTLVFWSRFIWGQIAIQFLTSTALVILIGWYRPLDSAYANNMELLTEVATLWILYTVICFSNFILEPATRHLCGYGFIGVLALFVAIHLLVLVYSICKALKFYIRKRYYDRKKKQAMKVIRAKWFKEKAERKEDRRI